MICEWGTGWKRFRELDKLTSHGLTAYSFFLLLFFWNDELYNCIASG